MTLPLISATSSSSDRRPEPVAGTRQRLPLRNTVSKLMGLPGLAALVSLAGVIVFWELAVRLFAVPSYLLPSPSSIFNAFSSIGIDRWGLHLWATLRVAMIGYVLSIAIAIPLAIVMMRSPLLSKTLYPLLVVIQSTPVVAVAPIIIVVLGAGDAPRVVITCLITFFPLVVSTATGLAATPPELIELSRSLRAPAFREITQIRLPFAVPYIFSALKISITLAVIGAVVAEFCASEAGVGYFIQFSTSLFKLPQAWAGLFVLAALSLILFQAVLLVQKLLFPWSLPKNS
ncbi:ABC transporter permease subunit [Agrobacterium vitis]|nr:MULTISPECIES: ABC transporter permease [Rhizobium/Agrobacterium group]MCF1491306.1 ABC transporter permease [Allorhizobium ampelinum]MUO26766.1 ABC transporter permease subunit [Agrobacterium vitis]MUO40184.1 ABC transporter permease subunit [Agrobacterium vitis]MUP08761.1 ABC transporter permease subunit [Agrobacterium vitis]MVA43869.1 ABC transporter permease subunit [Agrobacterium vitis]